MQRIFGREPALWIAVIAAALSLAVTFKLPGLGAGNATAIVAVLNAGAAIVMAWQTRPIAPSLYTGFFTTLAVLAAGYGLHVTQEQLGAVELVVVSVLTLVARGHITPVADPRPLYPSTARH